MNLIQKIEHWGDTHQPKWLALFRILLGIIILLKGIFFIQNTSAISEMIANSAVSLYAVGLAHYVALAHLMGGILIILGLLTRVAILFQIPVLLGAIIFVNAERGFFSMESELGLSLLVLALLIFFLFSGSGAYSVDNFMRKHEHT
ncbi:MAG: DoxX family membrane protein [Bacteroidetes bacterium]|nr:MAG: DoxX family membrane protein [Bacteroidota bacterium]REK03497.1 MAG: DoxX family membrane protein [Bacteroidota bacterium]REK34802.1 MAG: DoxX family membrane protein [Bacteroidota bacterium]REK51318.1 MAG: DoxX family membrane protein [Bacteroidota bacterium]